LSIEYFSSDSSHVSGAWSAEALCVVVATSVLDGEGIASEPLYWILLRVVLGNPQRLEFLWEK
jgi:hypothetical protein